MIAQLRCDSPSLQSLKMQGSDILEWLRIGMHTPAEQHDDTDCPVDDRVKTGLEGKIWHNIPRFVRTTQT